MKNKLKVIGINIKLFFRTSGWSLFVLLIWFTVGAVYYSFRYPGDIPKIILNTFYLSDPTEADMFVALYTLIGTVIILQGVFSFLLAKSVEKANPEVVCKELAVRIEEPVVIIHYGHIGRRIAELLKEKNVPYIIIEDDPEVAEPLLDGREPVIISDYDSEEIIRILDPSRFRAVVMATNKINDSLVLLDRIRKVNKDCPILIRTFDDLMVDILEESPYRAVCFSTSRTAMEYFEKLGILNTEKSFVIIGVSNFTKRLVYRLLELKKKVAVIDDRKEELDYFEGTEAQLFSGDPTNFDYLRKIVGIENYDAVIFGYHETDPGAVASAVRIKKNIPKMKVYMRVYAAEISDFLNTLGVKTFSSSALTLEHLEEYLIETGLF